MTVIIGMRLSEDLGLLLSDSQATKGDEERNIATKLTAYRAGDREFILAGAGYLGPISYLRRKVRESLSGDAPYPYDTVEHTARNVAALLQTVRDTMIDGYFQRNHGVRYIDMQHYHAGHEAPMSIGPEAVEAYQGLLKNEGDLAEEVMPSVLVLGHDASAGTALYSIPDDNVCPEEIVFPYSAVGSGQSAASDVLADFCEDLDDWNEIAPVAGLSACLYALDKSVRRRAGVGGRPQLALLEDGVARSVAAENVQLATEIIRASSYRGYVSAEFAAESVEELLLNPDGDWTTVDEEFWKASSDPSRLSLFLRGYRV